MQLLQKALPNVSVCRTDDAGVPADWVEAAAFAWLAQQCMEGKNGSISSVTGANGPRILGAIYQA
jgi:anhydro-N-acetylmuramic acid kinase